MTEEEWKTCSYGTTLLREVRSFNDARKLRLLAVGCCRSLWPHLTDFRSYAAIDVAENFADDLASREELVAASSQADEAWRDIRDASSRVGWRMCAAQAAWFTADGTDGQGWSPWRLADVVLQQIMKAHAFVDDEREPEEYSAAVATYARLVRDIIPNRTGRLPSFPTDLLAWNNGTIPQMALAIYDDRELPRGTFDHGRLAVLADALEEAGCDNPEALAHLRDGGDHVRGYWVIDGLLGKS